MITNSERIIYDFNIREEYNVKVISGSDEVGRGAMAGPIVVASVILNSNYENPLINDSKKISAILRERLYDEIIANAVSFSIKIYDNDYVDKFNPKKTSIIGMQDSIASLTVQPELCLLDAEKISTNLKTLSIIKGDEKSQVIGAASILAKVTRDRMMIELGETYPDYGFEKHKGYCTKVHIANVKKFGVLSCHRKTYKPISSILEE